MVSKYTRLSRASTRGGDVTDVMDDSLYWRYYNSVKPPLTKSFSRLAALVLLVVWFAGPLGGLAQGLLLSFYPRCTCPGHSHHDPATPGPAFAPCDHEAAANAASERFTVFPVVEAPVRESVAPLAVFTPSVHEGPSYLPETPPPKARA